MTLSKDGKSFDDIDEGFRMLSEKTSLEASRRDFIEVKQDWKTKDPEGYKKDMEEMCKKIFGDQWQFEYELMLKEEFPEDS
jgi:hypothetical protein